MTLRAILPSPIGPLTAERDEIGVTALYTEGHAQSSDSAGGDESAFTDLVSQLDAYWSGRLRTFELPLSFQGTVFQEKVWHTLVAIPYGETISYAELACRIGNPRAVRAVARANATNPIAIIVPCHRVIGSDGSFRGYAGGIERKISLIEHERTMTHGAAHSSL
ncbi:MAG: methylated-DNA--[protein]-cysteine S-methyltransferase [Actinomycetota bacterium]|nr:methylated-DNA--[protein]-cysteine S-methyltransferase [Actinomycetota bacterium]